MSYYVELMYMIKRKSKSKKKRKENVIDNKNQSGASAIDKSLLHLWVKIIKYIKKKYLIADFSLKQDVYCIYV